METLIQANIFFFITSIAVILLTVALVVIVVYVVRILRDAQHISEKVRKESDAVIADVSELREAFRKRGFKLAHLSRFIKGRTRRKTARPVAKGKA